MRVLTADLVDFEERAAGVLWVQLHVAKLVGFELVHDADAERRDPRPARCVVITLSDDHVATLAAATLKVTAARRARPCRRNDLEHLVADREERVLKTEVADARIAIANPNAEYVGECVLDGRELVRNKRDLSQSEPHGQFPRACNEACDGRY